MFGSILNHLRQTGATHQQVYDTAQAFIVSNASDSLFKDATFWDELGIACFYLGKKNDSYRAYQTLFENLDHDREASSGRLSSFLKNAAFTRPSAVEPEMPPTSLSHLPGVRHSETDSPVVETGDYASTASDSSVPFRVGERFYRFCRRDGSDKKVRLSSSGEDVVLQPSVPVSDPVRWIPFVCDDELYAVCSSWPLSVIKIDASSGSCSIVQCRLSDVSVEWKRCSQAVLTSSSGDSFRYVALYQDGSSVRRYRFLAFDFVPGKGMAKASVSVPFDIEEASDPFPLYLSVEGEALRIAIGGTKGLTVPLSFLDSKQLFRDLFSPKPPCCRTLKWSDPLPEPGPQRRYTFVTAFFDLCALEPERGTKGIEASVGVKNLECYYEKSRFLMGLDEYVVFFVEPKMVGYVTESRRKNGFGEKTLVIETNIQDLPYYCYKDLIEQRHKTFRVLNMPTIKYSSLYHVVIHSKIDLVLKVLEANPFDTTHFAWIDFGLTHVATTERYKESFQFTDYPEEKIRMMAMRNVFPEEVKDIYDFFRYRRGKLAMGLFAGTREAFLRFNDVYKDTVIDLLINKGIAIPEEDVTGYISALRPDLFDFYYGDYVDLIDNFVSIRRVLPTVVANLKNCIGRGKTQAAFDLSRELALSHLRGHIALDESVKADVFSCMTPSSQALSEQSCKKINALRNSSLVQMTECFGWIDHVYYINLDSRPDRKEELLRELGRVGIPSDKVTRFPAVSHSYGAVGCSLSHIGVLKESKKRGFRNVLILEDDFNFVNDVDRIKTTLSLFYNHFEAGAHSEPKWNVLTLATSKNEWSEIPGLPSNFPIKKVIFSYTASGYVVNGHFYDTLLKVCEKAVTKLEETRRHEAYAIDTCVRDLQRQNGWFMCRPSIGYQRPGLSNIERSHTNYVPLDTSLKPEDVKR